MYNIFSWLTRRPKDREVLALNITLKCNRVSMRTFSQLLCLDTTTSRALFILFLFFSKANDDPLVCYKLHINKCIQQKKHTMNFQMMMLHNTLTANLTSKCTYLPTYRSTYHNNCDYTTLQYATPNQSCTYST